MGGVGDGRCGGRVEIVVAVGGIAVVVAALKVDVGREAAVGVGFGILVVSPGNLEVAVAVVGGAVALDTFFGDAVTDVEIALVLVAAVVVAAGFGGPAEVGVDIGEKREVEVVAEGKIVASVLEVIAAVVHPAVGREEDTRAAVVGDGEECEGNRQRGRDILDSDIGGTGDKLVAGNDFGLSEVDCEMGVCMVAGGVLTAAEVHDRVVHLLDAVAVEEPIALLGDDTRNDALLGAVVEGDGVGDILGIVLFEKGVSGRGFGGVGRGCGKENLMVEVDAHVVGLEFHAVVVDGPLAVELRMFSLDIKCDRVGCPIMYN